MLGIRSKLAGTNKVIVIDEAQHLKLPALEELRTLTDADSATGTPGNGVALIGNTEVYSRMMGRQQAQFAQLFSRIRMNRNYTTRKVKKEDVRALFPRLAEENRTKAEVRFTDVKNPVGSFIFAAVVLIAAAVFMMYAVPELLKMVDNFITQIHPEDTGIL